MGHMCHRARFLMYCKVSMAPKCECMRHLPSTAELLSGLVEQKEQPLP